MILIKFYILLRVKAFLCFVPLLLATNAHALESDTFNINRNIEDSKNDLNNVIQNVIASSIIKVNLELRNKKDRCDEDLFFKKMEKNLEVDMLHSKIGVYIEEILARRKVQKVDLKTSIYGHWDFFYLFMLGSNVKLGTRYISNDKIDHFLQQGYDYFKKVYKEYRGLKTAINYGDFLERSYYGLLVAGIYSHADLVANFNGMRFYNHIFGHFPDALRIDFEPILKCEDGTFQFNRKFNWGEYIDNAWREDINCSNFLSQKHLNYMKTKDIKNIQACNPDSKKVNSQVRELSEKYQNFSPYLLNEKWKNIDVIKRK